jgi:hypothetical protein
LRLLSKNASVLNDKDTYQLELDEEPERIRRRKASGALKESKKREALGKADQGNLFTTICPKCGDEMDGMDCI